MPGLIWFFLSFYYPSFCPYISYYLSPSDSSTPVFSPISAAARPVITPRIYRAVCYHHICYSRIPGLRPATRHNFMIGQVTMYCGTVFCQGVIYTPISSNSIVSSTAPMDGCTHAPASWRSGPMPDIHQTSRWWNPARHHNFAFWATFLDPKKICRSYVDLSTKGAKQPVLCPRPKHTWLIK